jgi:hypothetical protein
MNSRRAKIIAVAIGVVLLIVDGALFVSKNRAPQTPPALTNAEEAVLQQQIADIIASKNEANCATLTNETYRLACEQILGAPQGGQKGTLLQTVPTKTMTEAQLVDFLKNVSLKSPYVVSLATTTP